MDDPESERPTNPDIRTPFEQILHEVVMTRKAVEETRDLQGKLYNEAQKIYYEQGQRLTKLERQVADLDSRVYRLEEASEHPGE